jgi:hypothetical protein
VKDSNGLIIGRYMTVLPNNFSYEAVLLKSPAGRLVAVAVSSAGFAGTATGLFYVSPDCSGTPYFYSSAASTQLATYAGFFGTTVYVQGAPAVPFTANSVKGSGPNPTCIVETTPLSVPSPASVGETFDVSQYVPPFFLN